MPEFSLQEVVPGVLVALGGVCNRGIISGSGNVLIVDSGLNVTEATLLRTAAQEYCKEGSLSLFNTHPHGDHVYGNQVFTDGPIIAHEGVREDLMASGELTLAKWKQNSQWAQLLSDVTITLPTLTFEDEMTVSLGDIEIELLYSGRAHSPSDSVAWLPQSRTLFAGDLLFNTIVPAMPLGGNAANWVHALERLEQLGAEHVIPGHGPVQTAAELANLRNWLVMLRTHVGNAIASGWDRETTLTKVAAEMQAVAPRGAEERLPAAIGQVFDELSREDI
ncbi:MAG TPA: MBL fold metallo-hydrolase [Ktedonobacteraceae bacterium]|nr:MBL fold metallo-hydrolase [Ktedonobacteraceae bacterium]